MEGLSLVASNIQEDATTAAQKHFGRPHHQSRHHTTLEQGDTTFHDTETHPSSWVCAFGALLFLTPSYGFPTAMGTLQTYLHENQLSEHSSGNIGWIIGLYTALTLFVGIQAGPVVDRYSPNIIAPLSSILTIPMFFLLAECTQYWHFILCLGLLGGVGGAFTSTLALSVVGKLFTRLRGLAIGVALAGTAVGGVAFPFMLRELLPVWGYTWTMRCLAAVVAFVMILGTLCFRPYVRMYELHLLNQELRASHEKSGNESEEDSSQKVAVSAAINFTAFRSPSFITITVTYFIMEFVIFGVSGTLPAFSDSAGNSREDGYNLIAIINGVSCVGRIFSGFIGDKMGHCNLLFLCTVATAGCVGATLVPFGTTKVEALYAFAAIWGMSAGCFSVLISTCLGKICDQKDYGRFYGTLNFTVSFSLLITVPIGGKMLETLGGTALAGLYAGILCVSAGGIFVLRALLAGSWTDWRKKV